MVAPSSITLPYASDPRGVYIGGSDQRGEGGGLAREDAALEQPLEPGPRDGVGAVAGAPGGARHRGVRGGVAAERHDGAESLFETRALADDLQPDRAAEKGEALVGPVDRPRASRRVHEVGQLLASLTRAD